MKLHHAPLLLALLWFVSAPLADVDQLGTCLTCHDDLTGSVNAPVPHAPVQAGECSACHNANSDPLDPIRSTLVPLVLGDNRGGNSAPNPKLSPHFHEPWLGGGNEVV